MREVGPEARFYQASSSEMFGKVREVPQNEQTPFYPRSRRTASPRRTPTSSPSITASPTTCYASSGILFNHESPRRGLEFVTRKISWHVAAIKLGLARRALARQPRRRARLGLRQDYVEAMWLMLQQDEPDDYVIATNETHSVRERVEIAFDEAGRDWEAMSSSTSH